MHHNSPNKNQQLRQRFNVNLKAEISPATQKTQKNKCRVINLSQAGARLHFEKPSTLPVGMQLSVKIFIPSTALHITNSGEIMWIKQQLNECTVGIKFKEFLSETIMEQLTKN